MRRRGTQARRHPNRRFDPNAPPRPPRPKRFEDLVAAALDDLPDDIRPLLDNVAIVIEDEPTADQLGRSRVPWGATLYGLYQGVSPINYGADWATVPNKITIFRLPLEEDFPNPNDLALQVQRTVLHEIGHHAGMDHARLRKAGFR